MRNARDNLLSLYRRQGYDYAPVSFFCCESQNEAFFQRTGTRDMSGVYNFPEAALSGPPVKTAYTRDTYLKYYSGLQPGAVIDLWGIAYEKGSEYAFHMTHMRHPLENARSVDDILAYEFPETDHSSPTCDEADAIKKAGLAAVYPHECSIWERAWYIRGFEELLMDMMEDDAKAAVLLDIITDKTLRDVEYAARKGADIIRLGDDIGMQHTIMMSRELYQAWLKPRLKRVTDAAKNVNPDILIQYHTCGFAEPLIEDLIEAGVDILNPVQPECMDFAGIHAKYGDRLSFNGTIGTQRLMPFGTPEEVRAEVCRNLSIAGKKGGLFCCPTHMIEPEVPWENIEAYVSACKEFVL